MRAGVIGVFFIAISVVEALWLLPNLRCGLAENVTGLAVIFTALAGAWVAFSHADHEDRLEILERGFSSVRKELDGVDKKSEESQDNFAHGFFWELYLDLERSFLAFPDYVPYLKGNEATYSFKLWNLIVSVGGYVDSAFLEMARYSGFAGRKKCRDILSMKEAFDRARALKEKPVKPPGIREYLEAFEEIYGLSRKEVLFKCLPQRIPLLPFKNGDSHASFRTWWGIYIGEKHDLSCHIRDANVLTTRDALASAFLLNAIHIPSAIRLCEYGILKAHYPKMRKGIATDTSLLHCDTFKTVLEKGHKYPAVLETNLFLYGYE